MNQSHSSQTTLTLKDRQILLVEDCVDQGRLYLKILLSAGAEVRLECDGQSAIDAVRKPTMLFDIVVMDFQMPKVDGLEATRQLRDLGYTGMIVAMTVFDSDELKQLWFQAGCDVYLVKPFKKTTLINILHSPLNSVTPAYL